MELLDALEWRYASKKMSGDAVPENKVQGIFEAIGLAHFINGFEKLFLHQ